MECASWFWKGLLSQRRKGDMTKILFLVVKGVVGSDYMTVPRVVDAFGCLYA